LHRITGLSLRKRSVVLLAALLVGIMGAFGITRLQTELFPSLEFPVVAVITSYPGAPPDTVDTTITQPIENAVRTLPGIDTIQTTSSDGFSVVIAQFDFGAPMKDREQEALAAISSITLPEGAGRPDVQRINFNQFPIVQLALTGADGNAATLRDVALSQIVPVLSGVDGVNRVEVTGGADDVVRISLDPVAMADANLTPQTITGVLQANNLSVPAGAVQTGGATLPVRVGNQIASLDDIKALVVGAGADGAPITLGQIATVEVAAGGAPGIARTNGEPSVALDVYLNQGANTVDTAEGVRDELETIKADLAASGVNVETTVIEDQSVYIQESIDGLIREAGLGAIFAVIVIFAFLLSFRSTIVTAVSIPLSVLLAFIVLWTQGITLNIMTLGALAVAVGRVVDDSIVVLESIYRHTQRGEDSRTAAYEGTKEVALAITASTITTVAVFLPLGFVGGIIGEIFRPFALTITYSLLASLLVALTVVPVLASFLIRRDKLRPVSSGTPFLQRIYEPTLRWTLRRPIITLVVAALLFVGSFVLVPFIGTSFLPASGEKIASIEVDMPAGTSQDTTVAKAVEMEQVIRDTAEVERIQTQVGGEGLQAAFTGAGSSRATITVRFNDAIDLNETLDALRVNLGTVTGDADVTVAAQGGGFGGGNNVQVVVQGDDYALVSQTAQELTTQIAGVENLANVENDVVDAKPEIVVDVDPAAATSLGSSTQQIAGQVRQALAGSTVGQMTIDGVVYPVSMIVSGAATDAASLGRLPVGASSTAPLSQVATITEATGPVQIIRIDGQRAATVSGSITTDETGAVTMDVTKIVDDYQAPEGVEVSIGGVSQDQSEAFAGMGIALLAAVVLVYIVMVASFGSLTTPFVILFSLPLALIGVLLALFLTGKSLGLPALIGVLMLIGIVVTNAIVLLEYVIELRHRGLPLVEALVEGGKTRIRPILMTAIATILALTPLALTQTSGAIIAADLAVVVIGGLLTSTLLTLIVVPVIFKLIGGWQERRELRHQRTVEPAVAIEAQA
jgi:HAE1 family hydrophobic/amphiphilic exporter-1